MNTFINFRTYFFMIAEVIYLAESRIYGYARVSTVEQNLDRQIDILKNYVPDERNIITEKKTGKNFDRPAYRALRDTMLRNGDTLYIEDLDRLGRNKKAIKDELEHYRTHGIIVRVLDVPTTLVDFSQYGFLQRSIMDMVNNILIEVLGTLAEQELTIKKKRQREGIDAAKARGKHLGRPHLPLPENWNEVYSSWCRKEITAKTAMEKMRLKRTHFYMLVKKAKMEQV